MSPPTSLRLDMLPAPQRRLWDELGEVGPDFVLYGGTALALRLAHRHSEDFDFFSSKPFEPRELLRKTAFLNDAVVRQEAPNTLTCSVDRNGRVLVSFFGRLTLSRIHDPDIAENEVRVASLRDLAATKMVTIAQRANIKDYLDVDAFLSAGISLEDALAGAKAVYGRQYSPLSSLRAISFFEEGTVQRLGSEVRSRLIRAVQGVDVDKLPEIRSQKGLV